MTKRRVVRLLSKGLGSASKLAMANAHAQQTHPMPHQPGAIA